MKGFAKALSEVRGTINKLFIFETILNGFLVFLVLLFILSFFAVPYYYPLSIALLYWGVITFRRLRVNKIRLVEKTYSNLDEKLRTAAEFAESNNQVIQELQHEVIADLSKVEEAAFISEKRIYLKAVLIVALCFAVLFVSPLNLITPSVPYTTSTEETPEPEATQAGEGSSRIKFSLGNEDAGLIKAGDDIFGEAAVAQLGNEELKVRIQPAGSELSISELQEAEPIDFPESYPEDFTPSAVSAESYQEDIPEDELELVKNYFNQLAES